VNIPVKLHTAVEHKEVRFQLLHEKDGGKVHMQRVCSKDGEEVPWDEVAKGYPLSKQKLIMVKAEELKALDPEATRSIEITDFVELSQIDPIYYESTYYLAPAAPSAAKAYALLLAAMERQGKVGIAHFVMRTKQYLCAIRPLGHALALSTMSYADEIRAADAIEGLPVTARPGKQEVAMAEQLVEQLAGPFEPERYRDEYREKVLELIDAKGKGAEVELPEAAPRRVAVGDLVEQLRASLGGRTDRRDGSERRAAARRRRSKPKRRRSS
jgi:DNA end-binding protein Ku